MLLNFIGYALRRAPVSLAFTVALLAAAAASAAASIVFDTPYECGNGKPEFKVISCSGGRCDIFWYNQFSPGGGYHSQPPQAAVESSAAKCHVLGKKTAGRGGGPTPVPKKAQVAAAPGAAPKGPLYVGPYKCYTLSGGRLQSAMAENFTLLGGGRYRDSGGGTGTYAFSNGIVQFSGGALNGKRAKYEYYPLNQTTAPKLSFWMPSRSYWGDECDGSK